MKDLTKGNISKLLFAFALPILIGSILQLTYSLIDTRIVGSALGEDALAAVGATSSLSSLLVGFLQGLTNGFAVIAAQFFGAHDMKGLKRCTASSLVLGSAIALVITAAALIFLQPLLCLLNIPSDVIKLSSTYISIIFMGLIVSMLYNVCSALLRAIGDTVTPLIFLGISVILNIFLDLVCILPLGMGVRGAAVATVISQFLAMLACFIYMIKRYEIFRLHREDFGDFSKELLTRMFSCGLSMGFMSSLVNLGSVALQTSINTLGTDIIVAHTAARKISELYMLIFGVFGTTMATFCGQNLGANEIGRIKSGIKKAILYTWIWCAGVIVVSYLAAPKLIYMVTGSTNQVVIQNAVAYLKFDTLFYFVTALICIIRNAMQGIGDHITPLISSSLELIGKVVFAFLLVPSLKYQSVILAEPAVWFIMVIPLLVQITRTPILKESAN